MNPMLDMRDIGKTYRGADGDVSAVHGVSLHVDAGEFAAVRGPSGCGKSTLLMTAGGLLAPDSGTVSVNGVDPYALSPDDRARFRAESVGFVFQQFHLVPYLSVIENVIAPTAAHRRAGALERADELVKRFNLAPRRNHLPSELSTGERQRTALARALLNEPVLLLADEPTGNLDEVNADVVLAVFEEFVHNGGSVLMVTHSAEAAARAERTVSMTGGRLKPEKS